MQTKEKVDELRKAIEISVIQAVKAFYSADGQNVTVKATTSAISQDHLFPVGVQIVVRNISLDVYPKDGEPTSPNLNS